MYYAPLYTGLSTLDKGVNKEKWGIDMCSIWDFKIDLRAYAHLYTYKRGEISFFEDFFWLAGGDNMYLFLSLHTSHIYKFTYVV